MSRKPPSSRGTASDAACFACVQGSGVQGYKGTSLIRKDLPLGPYCRPMPRILPWSYGVGVFLWLRYPWKLSGSEEWRDSRRWWKGRKG